MQLPRRLGSLAQGAALVLFLGLTPAASQMPGGGIPSLPGGISVNDLPPDIQRQLRDGGLDNQAPEALEPSERGVRALGSAAAAPTTPSLLEEQYSRRAGRPLDQIGYPIFSPEAGVTFREVGAVHDNYVLGIGDELVVHFRGRSNNTTYVKVDREGAVVLPELPPVPAAGVTFGEFRDALRQEASQRMLGTEIFVSVSKIREIAITMTGEVGKPGVVTLTGLGSLIDALRLAGGIKKTGSLRSVKIIRGGTVIPVDLYDFVLGRADAQSMSLTNGDRIYVPVIGNTVAVSGQAKRPGIYELPENVASISSANLLELGGGVWVRGDYRYAVLRVQPNGTEQLVSLSRPSTEMVGSGEILFVEPAKDVTLGSVTLDGHVRLPGPYPLSTASTVRNLLRGQEGLLADPYLPFAVLETADARTLASRYEKFDLGGAISGRQDMRLSSGDRVFVLGLEHIRFLSSSGVAQALQGTPAQPGASCAGLDALARWVLANPNSDLASGQFANALRSLVGGNTARVATLEQNVEGAGCPALFDQHPGLLTFVLQNSIIVRGNVLNPGAYPVADPSGIDQVMALARVLSVGRQSSVQAVGATAALNRAAAARAAGLTQDQAAREPAPQPVVSRRASVADVVEVQEARVTLAGHVRFPGTRSLSSARTVADLIGDDSQFKENPYLLYGIVLRRNPRTLMREVLPFSPADALSGGESVPLIDRDIVWILGFDEVQRALREGLAPLPEDPGAEAAGADGQSLPGQTPGSADAAGGGMSRAMPGAMGGGLPSGMSLPPGTVLPQGMGANAAGFPGGPQGTGTPGPLAGYSLPQGAGTGAGTAAGAGGLSGGLSTGVPGGGPGYGLTAREDGMLPPGVLARLLMDASVELMGEVIVPGRYPIVGELTLDRILSAAGGLAPRADLSAVEITRFVLDPERNEMEVERQLHDLKVVQATAIRVAPGAMVRVNPLISEYEVGSVEIRGEVKRPGRYGIVRGEKLSSLIQRAGGLQPLAYPTGGVFTRESVRQAEAESRRRAAREFHRAMIGRMSEPGKPGEQLEAPQIEVMTDLLNRLQSADAVGRMVVELNPIVLARRPELDVTLEGGDLIVIPRRPLSVLVSGEVFNPGAQQFTLASSVTDYLEAAGGTTDEADLSNAFIVRPNGSAERINLSVWGSSDNEILPGSWIVVPRDLTPFRLREFATTFTGIFSQLAVGAASLAVISRNN